jgi:hypothetical protein
LKLLLLLLHWSVPAPIPLLLPLLLLLPAVL